MNEINEQQYEVYDEQDSDIEQEFGMEEGAEMQGASDDYADSTPQFSQKDDLFSLFWKVVMKKDSSKIAYLGKEELGMLDISVRDCQLIATKAELLGRKGFAKYFRDMAEIILATSSSKEGFLANLFVSQRKFSTKTKGVDNSANFNKGTVQRKKGLFGKR